MSTIPAIQMPGLTPPVPPAQATRPVKVAKPADKRGWWWGTGRRKTAVARIRIRPATGPATFVVIGKTGKKKTPEVYFAEDRDRNDCYAAFKATNMEGKFEVVAVCHGGGFMGQAQAIRLGIARALSGYDPTCEAALRQAGFLTRDSREVERKKYGQAGARRRFQFSKR
ncbi:30S ribosomal protein S9 [Phycisphaerales bacterium]|nr:30S ribosomal protein S9 [Phycisphaerales bacterium]